MIISQLVVLQIKTGFDKIYYFKTIRIRDLGQSTEKEEIMTRIIKEELFCITCTQFLKNHIVIVKKINLAYKQSFFMFQGEF